MPTESWNEYYERKRREIEALPDDPKPAPTMTWEEYYTSRKEMIERGELVFEMPKAHVLDEKVTNTPEPKDNEKKAKQSIDSLSPNRQRMAERWLKWIKCGDWKGVSLGDIDAMMHNILGIGEPLDEADSRLCDKLWYLMENGKGKDRVKIVFQNMIGYFISKGLLSSGSKSQNIKFFNDEGTSYTNIDKGKSKERAAGFECIVPLLDKFCPVP